MPSVELRPPLPEALAHREVPFVVPGGLRLPALAVAAIAVALTESLPAGDFCAMPDGSLAFSEAQSAWSRTAREEALERSTP